MIIGENANLIKRYLVAAALSQGDMVRYFVEQEGLHPDATFGGKPTALCYTVLKPHHETMKYLINSGADVDKIDQLGMRPLHYAAMGGCLYCLSYLIACGAEVNAGSKSGKTALKMTEGKPHLRECREFLLHHGASNTADQKAMRAFH
ncbi:MAG: ankyrin repeat domain-containing protein [Pseudomonadota bacterium]